MVRLRVNWCIPYFNLCVYLHAGVEIGYFQLLMMSLGVPSDLPAVSYQCPYNEMPVMWIKV